MKNLLILILFSLPLSSYSECLSRLIDNYLKNGDSYLPVKVKGINSGRLSDVTELIKAISKRFQIPEAMVVDLIRYMPRNYPEMSPHHFVTVIRRKHADVEQFLNPRILENAGRPKARPKVNKSTLKSRRPEDFLDKSRKLSNGNWQIDQSVGVIKITEARIVGAHPTVDFSEPFKVTYPKVELKRGVNRRKVADEYLSTVDDLEIGPLIGEGGFKRAYRSEDGSKVIKIFEGYDTEGIATSVQRELAMEDFLLQIQARYREAGVDPPFTVARINRDPELINRGIIVQDFVEGKPLDRLRRSELDSMYPEGRRKLIPEDLKRMMGEQLVHHELTRIPEIREIDAILSAFHEQTIRNNNLHYGSVLRAKVSYVDTKGLIDYETRQMGIDYGDRFRNIMYSPRGNGYQLVFYDW